MIGQPSTPSLSGLSLRTKHKPDESQVGKDASKKRLLRKDTHTHSRRWILWCYLLQSHYSTSAV
jgi:hypothetical protein